MKSAMAGFAAVVLAGVILGSAHAGAQEANQQAQGFGPRRPPVEQALGPQGAEGRWWNNPRMIERLKLTDDQRKTMDQIFYDHRAKLIDLQANLQKAELALQPLMSADQTDQKAMETQIDKVVAARGELERANARFLLDIRIKLTPDQWKQLRELRGSGAGPQRWEDRRDGRRVPPGANPQTPPANGPAAPPAGGEKPGSGPGEEQ